MSTIWSKGKGITNEQRFRERFDLLRPIVKQFGNPVIVHAVHDENRLVKILQDQSLQLPNNHKLGKKHPLMETLLGIDNCLYYSLGFVYATAYKFKFNLMFDLSVLKHMDFYRRSLNAGCYRDIIEYWAEHDRSYLEKFPSINAECAEVYDNYFNKTLFGKHRSVFEYWRVEKELFSLIRKYPSQKKLMSRIKKVKANLHSKYPNSRRLARSYCFTQKVPEIVSHQDESLLSDYFLGFYIPGTISSQVKKQLKQKYSDKILYNGVSMKVIDQL